MSWPSDGGPRFKVSGPYLVPRDDGIIEAVARVLDRAYCHQVVATVRNSSASLYSASSQARALADRFEAAHLLELDQARAA